MLNVGAIVSEPFYTNTCCVNFEICSSLSNDIVAYLITGGLSTISWYYCTTAGRTEHLQDSFEGSTTSAADIALAFYLGGWAYGGW